MTMKNSFASKIAAKEAALEAEIDAEIRRADNADEECITYLIDKLRKRRALLTVKPEFTPEVVGIAKQIIAFGGAGIGVVLTFGKNLSPDLGTLTVTIATLYINLTQVSMAILIWFFFQARTRYPWLYLERLGNSTQYFYYNAVPANYRYRPFYAVNQDKNFGTALMQYLESLSKFSGHVITETKRNKFKNELIQYHLLLFYVGYLDQYEQQLTHMALYGFSASFLGALALFGARQVGLLP